MSNYKVFFSICGAVMAGFGFLAAQSEVSAAGGDGTLGPGSLSFTIGQVTQSYGSDGVYTLNQGVQQPHEFLVSVEYASNWEYDCNVFPNPASDMIVLSVRAREEYLTNQEVRFQLIDSRGNQLLEGLCRNDQTAIPVRDLPSGIYYLHLRDENGGYMNFKIIKI